jgi:periplasmic divalent cation tolerance protein
VTANDAVAVIIFATFGSRDEAERMGERLVEMRLAARGSVIPTLSSFYYRDGRIFRDHEALLLLKTLAGKAEQVEEFIRAENPEEAAEVLVVSVERTMPAYLDWVLSEVSEGAHRSS